MTITDLIEQQYGTRNWVLARRTSRIVERYGAGVVTLSQTQMRAFEKQLDIETAEDHPIYPWLKRLLGNHCDAVNIIKGMREEGFRIEKVRP